MSATIEAVTIQRPGGKARTYHVGDGVGVPGARRNGTIHHFIASRHARGGEVEVFVSLERPTGNTHVNLRDLSDWMTEEEIAELEIRHEAERALAHPDRYSVIYGDITDLADKLHQAANLLQEVVTHAPAPLDRMLRVAGMAHQEVMEALIGFDIGGALAAYVEYLDDLPRAIDEARQRRLADRDVS